MTSSLILWSVFGAFTAAFLFVDLWWLNRRPHEIKMGEAVRQTLFWVAAALAYAGLIWHLSGPAPAADFVSAYVSEKCLSMDNLFVIMCIFGSFGIADRFRHRILYWGIMGAVILRGVFIGLGTAVIAQFHWLLLAFGAFLIYGGLKIFFSNDDDEGKDFTESRVAKWAYKALRVVKGDGSSFFVNVGGTTFATTALVALLVVETSDLLFAADSIPAVLSITQDPLIAFTSNIFAVMGLRSLFFVVENLLKRLSRLQEGISAVLVWIGAKMVAEILFHVEVGSVASMAVVIGLLLLATAASFIFPKHEEA